MPRKLITLSDDMNEAIKDVAAKSDKPEAAFIRQAIKDALEREGYKVKGNVRWGGRKPLQQAS